MLLINLVTVKRMVSNTTGICVKSSNLADYLINYFPFNTKFRINDY